MSKPDYRQKKVRIIKNGSFYRMTLIIVDQEDPTKQTKQFFESRNLAEVTAKMWELFWPDSDPADALEDYFFEQEYGS